MSIIQSKTTITKTTSATLKKQDIAQLIANDLGVNVANVKLTFDLSYDYNGWGRDEISSASFSALKVEVVE